MNDRPCLLIADDDFSSRQITASILSKQGYELALASDGEQALAAMEERNIDVALLDVMMPGLSGFEVCQHMRANPRTSRIPVIILTALDGHDHLITGLDSGADEFLSKPVHPLELSARVRTMLRIKRQMDDLEGALQLREELASLIVHDMRNPLSVIIGYSQLLLASRASFVDPGSADTVRIIQDQAQRLHSFSNELLMVSKLEHGKLLLNRESVTLELLLQQSVQALAPLAKGKGISIIAVPPEGTPAEVEVDKQLFQRVIENLLSNALKFSPSGSRVSIEVEYPGAGPTRARLRVRDEGVGVSEECRHRIFDKYEIVSLRKCGVAQVGLGLYYCRLVTEAHGGRITVEPNAPQGSVFLVEL